MILLPDDKASHMRCAVALLYTGDFRTQSECDLQAQDVKYIRKEEQRLSSKSRRMGPRTAYVNKDGVVMITPDQAIPVPNAIVQTEEDLLTHAERAVAEDLAQIFMLGDKYQLPGLRCCALQKLDEWFDPSNHPIRFLHLVIALSLHIPESDSQLRDFVRTYLRKGVPQSRIKKLKVVKSIIENRFMRESAVLAEEILSAYAHDRTPSNSDSDSEESTDSSSVTSL